MPIFTSEGASHVEEGKQRTVPMVVPRVATGFYIQGDLEDACVVPDSFILNDDEGGWIGRVNGHGRLRSRERG